MLKIKNTKEKKRENKNITQTNKGGFYEIHNNSCFKCNSLF